MHKVELLYKWSMCCWAAVYICVTIAFLTWRQFLDMFVIPNV
jgi:hypothetical protein